ncbi:MAG: class II SORL domain-containing protein [Desulfurococcales archaeon]|nr:class II SORL domain-containing protein [Desulfurococcales archaeon]
MKSFGELIYTPETASGEAISKVESHTPRIDAPDTVKAGELFKVRIRVGPHPSKVEHSIRRLELYFYEEGRGFNPVLVASMEFTPVYTEPEVELSLRLNKSGILYAIGYCNLHGLWEARKEIRVIK